MIGFQVVNLLIPDKPESFTLQTATGTWTFTKAPSYEAHIKAIQDKSAETYFIEHPVSMEDGSAACDLALEEMTPILLGASYLLGLSVTANTALPSSDIKLLSPTSHWPRERVMGPGNCAIDTASQFKAALQRFVTAWPSAGQHEKVLLLVHHWLDSLSCWSFEDLYLSATTLLQIIAATETFRQGKKKMDFLPAVTAAAKRAGIRTLTGDFKNMRNSLIHDGKLVGPKFKNKQFEDCTNVAADVLNWFDEYMHSVLRLGVVVRPRFSPKQFISLNAYSL